MSSREFSEWMAYDALDLIGARRGDYQAGIIAAMVANVNRDDKKQPEPISFLDVIPPWSEIDEEEAEERKAAALENKMASLVDAL